MKLREHPALSPFGICAWPPVWIHSRSDHPRRLMGEIGIFTGSLFHEQIPNKLFVRMEFQNQPYLGCLIIKNMSICKQLHQLLKPHVGKTVQEIGDLDISDLL